MTRKYRTYEESLLEDLQDPHEALAYLNAALEDEDRRVFLLALKDVLKAQNIDISAFAQDVQITRQNIYRILSKTGNPRWDSLNSLLQALGLQVYLTRKEPKVVSELFSLDKKLHTSLLRQAAKQGISLHELINEKLRK